MPAKKIAFTPEQLKVLSGIFHAVWDYIAYDALQMTQEMDGRSYMKKDEVIEMCLDADRPTDFAKTAEEKALYKQWNALPYKEQQKLARKMFTYAKYSM